MKAKGGKPDAMELTRGQRISELIEQAHKAQKHIINKDYESATHPLAEDLKKFSQVF